MSTPRRVLLIAADFFPEAIVGAARPSKLAAALTRYGYAPVVLTTCLDCYVGIDDAHPYDNLDTVEVVRAPCRSPWRHTDDWRRWPPGLLRTGAKLLRGLNRATRWALPTDEWAPWMASALPAALHRVRREGIELIWATAPPLSAHVLAALVGRLTGTPVVLDFRDVPLSEGPREPLARAAIRHAAGIVTCTPRQFPVLLGRCPEVAHTPNRMIPNWFVPLAPGPRPAPSHTILYGGSLYGGQRRVDTLLEAIETLRRDSPARRVELVIHGSGRDAEMLKHDVAQRGIGDVVRIEGTIPRAEFAQATRHAGVLLVVIGSNAGNADHTGAIPAKLIEYMPAQRPILVIGPDDAVAGELVTRLNRGIFARHDDASAIASALECMLDEPERFDLSIEAVAEYGEDRAVRGFATFFDAIIGGQEVRLEPDRNGKRSTADRDTAC